MNILVLNAGSSSLKFRLFQMANSPSLSEPEEVLAGGRIECIGEPHARLTISHGAPDMSHSEKVSVTSAAEAVVEILRRLSVPTDDGHQLPAIDVVGHRIVHGGARFHEPVLLEDEVIREIRALTELAPLHNSAGLAGIESIRNALPHARNVAVFDTAFHHNLPEVAARYALPIDLAERLQLRRYGFHGISYRFVSERLSVLLENRPGQRPPTRIVICHLGSGASVCAIRSGKSVDTSMGFTPLEGLIMGSRSGDLDPGLVLHLQRKERLTVDQIDELLNHRSGLQGLSRRSGDVRELEQAAADGHQSSRLALECFAYRVRKYIGAYAAVLGGIDVLVFTGGIGEHSPQMRSRICQELAFLGLVIDAERNGKATGDVPVPICCADANNIWVVPTDEERQIARETFALLNQFSTVVGTKD